MTSCQYSTVTLAVCGTIVMLYLSHNPTTRTSRGIYTAPFGYLNRLIIRMSALVGNVRSPVLMAEMMAEKTEVKQTDRQTGDHCFTLFTTDMTNTIISWCSTQSERSHRCCHLPNKVENVDRSPNIPFSLFFTSMTSFQLPAQVGSMQRT